MKLCQGDRVPADIILLSTNRDDGSCFIETSTLDGEKNLKSRKVQEILNNEIFKRIDTKLEQG